MSTETVREYFITTDAGINSWLVGTEWDNYDNGSYPAGSAGAISITGAVQIPENATNVTVNFDLECGGTIAGICGDLNKIEIGTLNNMETVFFSGGLCYTCDLSLGCPVQNSQTLNLDNVAGETVYIIMYGTGPGNGYVSIYLNAYVQFDIPLIPATVTVSMVNPVGQAASGAKVVWTDVTQNTQGVASSDAEGVATITGVFVADTLDLEYEYAGLTAKKTVEVNSTNTPETFSFSCPAYTSWDGNACVNDVESALSSAGKFVLIAAGVIGGLAIGFELMKAVANKEQGPSVVENIGTPSVPERLKSAVSNFGQKAYQSGAGVYKKFTE